MQWNSELQKLGHIPYFRKRQTYSMPYNFAISCKDIIFRMIVNIDETNKKPKKKEIYNLMASVSNLNNGLPIIHKLVRTGIDNFHNPHI